jgi:predicted AAA+ superfamily ATPase
VFRRLAQARIRKAFADTPVVVVQGPRQCGKTTLVREFGGPFVTLDDSLALDAATRNPDGFIAQFPDRVVIDEVQRAPGLFRAIKKAVDADRRPGRFLLTGSSNVLLLPKLSESLAGRMEVVPLWPLSQAEIEGAEGLAIDELFSPSHGLPARTFGQTMAPFDWDRVCRGGFPEPFARASHDRASAWFDSYVTTVTERDVRDLSDIEGLTAMPRLLRVLARHCGESLNVSRISRETGIAHTTLTRYLSLLESVFLLRPLHAITAGAKTAKAEKLMFADTGLLAFLLGIEAHNLLHDEINARRLLECFVAMELVRLCDAKYPRYKVMHFRSLRTWSVPIVIAAPDGRIVGIDVCMSRHPSPQDFRALAFLQDVAGDAFVRGILLCVGGPAKSYSDQLLGADVSSLWAWTSATPPGS